MGLASLSIKRPVATLMMVLLVVTLGAFSLTKLTVDLFPNIRFPVIIVLTRYQGAGPRDVEKTVTKRIEGAVGTVSSVKRISSETREGLSIVIAEFNWGTDMDFAALEMREKVDGVKGLLPDGADEPMVLKIDPGMMPVIQLTLSGPDDPAALDAVAEDLFKSRLERLEGVASVNVLGGVKREVQVEVDPVKLQGYGLDVNQVVQILRAENLNMPGGEVRGSGKRLVIRATGEFSSLDEIREVMIPTRLGTSVRIGDIADVRLGYGDTQQITRLNEKPSVTIAVLKKTDANTVGVSRAVLEEIEKIKGEIPKNIEVAVASNSSEFIEESINSVTQNAVLGGVLAVVVLFLFLQSLRPTAAIAVSIPVSIIATFTLMYFAGLTLNMMSLGGLALGIGMLVDTSIVVIENITRHRQMGKKAVEASITGAGEVANAVTASTLTTIAVFLPTVFLSGIASEFFRELAFTVTFSLLASLVISLTLIPVLASRTLVNEDGGSSAPTFLRPVLMWIRTNLQSLNEGYASLLAKALTRPFRTSVVAFLAFLGCVLLTPFVGMEFMPVIDTGEISISVELPKGSPLEATDAVVRKIEDKLIHLPETETVFTTIGGTGESVMLGAGLGPELATIQARLRPRAQRKTDTQTVVDRLRREFVLIPGAKVGVSVYQGMYRVGGAPIQVMVKGDDIETLGEIATQVAERMKKVEGTREVKTSTEEGQPEAKVIIDRMRCASFGLSAAQVASTVRTAVQGSVATTYKLDTGEVDVRVRYHKDFRNSVTDLEALTLITPTGVPIPLSSIARIEISQGPVSISREGQSRVVTVFSELADRPLASVTADISRSLADLKLPHGYSIELGGEEREMRESFSTLYQALLLAVILVYLIMAAQYESLLHPLCIMCAVPLGFAGSVLGLAITGRSLNVPALIGVIMLAGIVVNNGIILVDFIDRLRREGMERIPAIIQAGRTRLRPILMTTLTTVFGLLPLALGIGEGSEMETPLATVVMFGLIFSTALTLIVVPAIYVTLEDSVNFVRRFFAGFVTHWKSAGHFPSASGDTKVPPLIGDHSERREA